MNPDRLSRTLQSGATLLGVLALSSGCVFVHLKGEAADRALREIAEEHHFDEYGHDGHSDVGHHEASSPLGEDKATMTILLDVPADELESTFETLSQGIQSRIANHGGEIIEHEYESDLSSLFTYARYGHREQVRAQLEKVEGTGGAPYRFVATWLE